jgi:hypothetical protein
LARIRSPHASALSPPAMDAFSFGRFFVGDECIINKAGQ